MIALTTIAMEICSHKSYIFTIVAVNYPSAKAMHTINPVTTVTSKDS